MSVQQLASFWKRSSQEDWRVAQSLFRLKHYPHALFFCHLALEKSLKGLVVERTRAHAPHTHDLVLLAERAGIALTPEQRHQLALITTFNVSGRYAEAKLAFSRRAKKPFAETHLTIAAQLLLWLRAHSLKKK